MTDTLVGMRLGEYEVLERIGEGGMGVVYRGVQPIIKKRVAIKVLKADAARDQLAVQRLVFEAEAVNSIRHRGIIDIFSLGRLPDGRPYIVMEFLEGEPLDVYLASHPVPLSDALTLLAGICRPLGAAHRAGVVHRDLKPSNVFICSSDGEQYLKLLDFGIAKRPGGDSEGTGVRMLGTPNYMAPEQARGGPITPSTDVYALGVIAFEVLTGHLPFRGEQVLDVIAGHLSAPVPSLVDLNPSLPDGLDALVRRMLSKDPAERPRSTTEVQQELMTYSASVAAGMHQGLKLRQNSSGDLPTAGKGSLTIDATLLSAGRLVAPPLPRTPRALVLGLAALVVVLALAIGLTFRGAEEVVALADAGVAAPSPGVDAAPAVTLAEPDAGLEPEEDAGLASSFDAGLLIAAVDAGTAVAVRPTKRVLTEALLLRRIAKLDAALRKGTASGDEPNPAAVALLQKYRLQATTRQAAAEREALWKTLDDFERTFLR